MLTAKPTALQLLDQQYLTMRERILSLAADLDRIERATGSPQALSSPKLTGLYNCLDALRTSPPTRRAETIQRLLSDQTPPPHRHP